MSSLIVFDPETSTVLEFDPEDPTSVQGSGPSSVLVFDEPELQDLLEAPSDPSGILALDPVRTDVLIGDPTPVTQVVPGEELPSFVLVDDDGVELEVITPAGPPGRPGTDGQDGDTKYDDMVDLTLLFENHLI